MNFKLVSDFKPTGDQPRAIEQLKQGILNGERYQTLLGVTGSGKTFTIANMLAELNRPALILSHNKTLAAQLYSEFKQFFPNNAVEYFVSYYDYYQPEAFIPQTNTYIEKDLSINAQNPTFARAACRPWQSPGKIVSCLRRVTFLCRQESNQRSDLGRV
mgnify:CR=1 FL=1